MIGRHLLSVLLVIALAFGGSVANGSGLGAITGPGSGVGSHDTGLRELVPLQPMGNLLIGRPVGSLVELIVIDAPGHRGEEANLMLRELETQNGFRSLLLAAPGTLEDSLRRITIYVRGVNADTVLLEQRGKIRERHLPQEIQSASNTGSFGDLQLLAYPLERLGHYWVSSANASSTSAEPPIEPTASALLGGGVSRGLLPWGLSGLLLIVIMSLSHWVHAAEKRRLK